MRGEEREGFLRDGRARISEAYRSVETGSVFSDRDDMKSRG